MKRKHTLILFLITILGFIILNKIREKFSITTQCKINLKEMQAGKIYISNSKIVICGLIRDAGYRIHLIKNKLYNVTKYFKDYRILIVENDSTDNTRKYLLDWSKEDNKVIILGCGVNQPECKLNLQKTIEHPIATWRIEKMIYLRNLCIDYIKNNLADFDLMMVYDLDLISSLDEKGLYHTGYLLNNKDIDAVCSNGITFVHNRYYDTYAHKELNNKDLDDLTDSDFRCNLPPRKVLSCFGGCTIYKIPSIINMKYEIEFDGNNMPLCEHRSFNKKMNVYYNPKWLHTVYMNP